MSPSKQITIPKLTSKELLAKAKKDAKLTYANSSYDNWDFMKDEGGKTYEVLTWKPGKYVTTQQVRDHFKDLEADGNTAAFISWITETKPAGYHVSIPSDNDLLCRGSGTGLCAPCFYCDDSHCGLGLSCVDDDWDGNCVFVAFAEVKTVKIKVPVNFFSQLADCVERSCKKLPASLMNPGLVESDLISASKLAEELRKLAKEESEVCGVIIQHTVEGPITCANKRPCDMHDVKISMEKIDLSKAAQATCDRLNSQREVVVKILQMFKNNMPDFYTEETTMKKIANEIVQAINEVK